MNNKVPDSIIIEESTVTPADFTWAKFFTNMLTIIMACWCFTGIMFTGQEAQEEKSVVYQMGPWMLVQN